MEILFHAVEGVPKLRKNFIFALFGISDVSFFSHVTYTLSSKTAIGSAQKSSKIK